MARNRRLQREARARMSAPEGGTRKRSEQSKLSASSGEAMNPRTRTRAAGGSGSHAMIRFWAKTHGPDGDYLPVEAHLLDTGEVALRLFDVSLTERQQAWIARGFGVTVERVRSIVGFLAAAHDIGKVGPFQHLVPGLAAQLGSAVLPAFVLGRPARHDRVSGYVLHRYITEHGGSREVAETLVAAVGGHHSVPQKIPAHERRGVLGELGRWWPHQSELLTRAAEQLGVGTSFDDLQAPGHDVTLVLAGLVNVSDWNASDVGRFPVTAGDRPASSSLASRAIVTAAWRPRPLSPGGSFRDAFGFPPRAAQAALVELLEEAELPAMILIEDRTGAGKTEAALWAVRQALAGGARGMYVGQPTRATADQFHGRAAAFVDVLWAGARHDLKLLHGGAHLRDETDPEPSDLGRDAAADEVVAARRWFDGARRGLLSPYAVGTIDQALLAVLRARFYPVRLWGLAGKVVVVDEAHAYDTYTAGLLGSLVRWLGAMECTVVMLSATLPGNRRAELTAAYRDGLRHLASSTPSAEAAIVGYPRVTIVNRNLERTIAVADDRPGRTLPLERLACIDDAQAVVEATVDEVEQGGCAALICSTVGLAQERYAALRATRPDVPAMLLHARMRPLERVPIERALAERLGPQAVGDERPDRLVVVATAVIEQSLDFDFDVMLTDLAPIDLLVQRAGRLHRHDRERRPPRHSQPRLLLLDTPDGEAVDRSLPRGAGAVYIAAVLARTRAALRGRREIVEPADLDELIATVYDDAVPPNLGVEEQTALHDLDRRAHEKARAYRNWATENGIGIPHAEDPPWAGRASSLQDGDVPSATPAFAAVTRWSERPSVDIVVLREDESALASAPIARTTVRELLRRAVSISDPRITKPLLDNLDEHRPSAWRRHGALSHHALAVLGRGTLDIDWDPELGVVV